VTVLFADVVGFTTLSERLDAEEVRALQGELFAELAGAIERADGFLEKYVGDAVMAVFGAPVAHEDDPERALHVALEMHRRVARLSDRWAARLGEPLALHAAVHTGPVVAGQLGTGAGAAYAVTGDTVNTTARLLGAAGAGETLVGPATVERARHAFAFEAVAPLVLRGKAEPVVAARLCGPRPSRRAARGLEGHGLAAPLVGRAEELAVLGAAFARALGGRAQLVTVAGEAGVGKSRLVTEFLARLDAGGRLAGVTLRRAACSSLGEQPYGVLAGLVRDAYGVTPDDPAPVIRARLATGLAGLGFEPDEQPTIVADLATVLGLEPEPAIEQVEPVQRRRQLFMVARMLVERRLAHSALLLVVEDLHWADAVSIELLRFLVDRLADRPLMLLATHRPEFDPGALATGRTELTTLRLRPLARAEGATLVAALFGPAADALPARVRELLVTRSGGNPLHVEELARSLIVGGVLVRAGERWTCATEVSALEVPPTLQALLLARVDRLPPGPRRLLQEAAVLGPTVDERLLRAVTASPATVDADLEVLEGADLLAEVRAPGEVAGEGGRRHRFAHALVQEVVYGSLLVRHRAALHARAGRALEALTGGAPQRLEEIEALGHHWSLSDDPATGAAYLVRAGDRARALHASDDGRRHYERALTTLARCEGGEAQRAAVRERLGDLAALQGQRAAALAYYREAASWFETHADVPARARLYRKEGALCWQAGDRARALACYEAGLARLGPEGAPVEQARLCEEVGRLAFRSGEYARAVAWAEQALAHAARQAEAAAESAEPEEHAAAVAHAHNTLGIALARLGRLEEAVAQIARGIAVAEAHGLLQAACRGYTNLGVLESTLDPGRAIETCRRGLAAALRAGDLGIQSRLYAALAVAYCTLTNRCDEQGVAAAHAAVDLDRRLDQVEHLAVPMIVLGQIHQCHGQPEAALRYYGEALAVAETVGDPQLLVPCYEGLATILLERGERALAEGYLVKAREACERAGLEPDALTVLPFLS